MENFYEETVLNVRHWNDTLFSFETTRSAGLRFESGQFVMIGLPNAEKPLMRAYSIASPSWQESLEFFSIKVPNGPLTSKLALLAPADKLLISKKPTGTLVLRDLRPGKRLFLLSTGTGLAPFMSLIRDPEIYERFEKVILVHGTRQVSELAYQKLITQELPNHEYLGEAVRNGLVYYPTVTREPYAHEGRVTDLIRSRKIFADLGIPAMDPETDRAMICGGPSMLADTRALLDSLGFAVSPSSGEPGDYLIERAFVE